jgi:hypothetical protein
MTTTTGTTTRTTDTNQSVVAVFQTHEEAEQAVRLLRSAGVPLQCISIISSDPSGARLGATRAVRLCRASEEG